jgi:radical SAM protein with 4Fe4S-binding SPASM domain
MRKNRDSLMSEQTYSKVLEDLRSVGYRGKIHLYLMGEPLADDRLPGMIQKARSMFRDNVIFISTNGDLLRGPEHVAELFKAGLTWMAVSEYDEQTRLAYLDGFPGVARTTLDALRPTFYNRAGHVDVECSDPRECCEWVFRKAYINYKGDVILCCSDYDYSVVFGNVNNAPFSDIYNSQKYRAYRRAHSLGHGHTMPLCENCNRILHPCKN